MGRRDGDAPPGRVVRGPQGAHPPAPLALAPLLDGHLDAMRALMLAHDVAAYVQADRDSISRSSRPPERDHHLAVPVAAGASACGWAPLNLAGRHGTHVDPPAMRSTLAEHERIRDALQSGGATRSVKAWAPTSTTPRAPFTRPPLTPAARPDHSPTRQPRPRNPRPRNPTNPPEPSPDPVRGPQTLFRGRPSSRPVIPAPPVRNRFPCPARLPPLPRPPSPPRSPRHPALSAFRRWAIAATVYVGAVFTQTSLGVAGLEAPPGFRITPGQLQRVRPGQLGGTRRCRCPPACWWTASARAGC